jgi:hypothetical protein
MDYYKKTKMMYSATNALASECNNDTLLAAHDSNSNLNTGKEVASRDKKYKN